MKSYICVDIGGTAIKSALITSSGDISQWNKHETPDTFEKFIQTIKKIIQKYPEKNQSKLAISMPGVINSQTGYVFHGGALRYIKNINLKEVLEKELGTAVTIENDGNCAALGEHWLGHLQGVDTGVSLVIGTGIAGGIIANGGLLRSKHFSAGEFSFIQTHDSSEDPRHLFGYQNSIYVLIREYAKRTNKELSEVDGIVFFKDVLEKQPVACEMLNIFVQSLVTQLFNLQMILDPDVISIGGGISQQSVLFELIHERITKYAKSYPLTISIPRVRQSKLGNDANLLGALVHLKKHLKEQ